MTAAVLVGGTFKQKCKMKYTLDIHITYFRGKREWKDNGNSHLWHPQTPTDGGTIERLSRSTYPGQIIVELPKGEYRNRSKDASRSVGGWLRAVPVPRMDTWDLYTRKGKHYQSEALDGKERGRDGESAPKNVGREQRKAVAYTGRWAAEGWEVGEESWIGKDPPLPSNFEFP
ncbi:hypothetical protein BJV78DRAFT_1152099 [Lactifluus subvellereus]|nr:hypothetical protein BJV78DRAFT_1152099 [Lactifluus subvellereus]